MAIRVLFFASLADITGSHDTSVEASSHDNVGSIFRRYAMEYPRLEAYRSSLLCAVNSEFAGMETSVREGDEVAFLPPVSGG
jgi:molybdopterin converting factor subunit 1